MQDTIEINGVTIQASGRGGSYGDGYGDGYGYGYGTVTTCTRRRRE